MKTKAIIAITAAIVGAIIWQAAQSLRLFQESGTYLVTNGDVYEDGRLILLAKKKWSRSCDDPTVFFVSRGSGGEIENCGYPPAEFTLSPLGKVEVVRWARNWGTQVPWLSQN